MTDLLDLTAELVDIPSVSHHEAALADWLETALADLDWLEVTRVGDNVVARTTQGHPQRLVLAGHTDTVPVNDNATARIAGDTLHGLGAADMKAGLAVFVDLARSVPDPAVDVTYVFYVCEEVEGRHNGLGHLFRDRPELLAGDAAILGEPTDGAIEAGCQGSMALAVSLGGSRAHTARAWMGVNAVHRLGPVLAALASYEGRRPVIDGCEYREAVQAVLVDGGVAANVVPDRAVVHVNHRFAPDRDAAAAEAHVRELLAPVIDEDGGDGIEVLDVAVGAAPGLGHPLLRTLIERNALEVRAKLGWTDVARFAALGIPACNLGPGEPIVAHTREERVERASIERTHRVLADLLRLGT